MPSTDTCPGPPTHVTKPLTVPLVNRSSKNADQNLCGSRWYLGLKVFASGVEQVGAEQPEAEGFSPRASLCYTQEEDVPTIFVLDQLENYCLASLKNVVLFYFTVRVRPAAVTQGLMHLLQKEQRTRCGRKR